jgi:hypothetical protein
VPSKGLADFPSDAQNWPGFPHLANFCALLAINFQTKVLRSKRRSSPCIFQEVAFLYQSKVFLLLPLPTLAEIVQDTVMHVLLALRPKKICGFPVSRPYLAFGRRNPDPKLFYWIMLVSVST